MEKIKTKYIIKIILSYIKDDSKKLELFKFSKKYQIKLGIQLFDYQKKYFDIIGINPLSKYLSMHLPSYYYKNKSETNLQKFDDKYSSFRDEIKSNGIDYCLTQNYHSTYIFFYTYALQEDLVKYKINIDIKEYFCKYIKNYNNELKEIEKLKEEVKEIIIDSNQPFFDIIYKLGVFEELFYILIDITEIEKYNIKDKYISAFNKLNKINSNYSSISFCFKKDIDIKYLKDFNINFNQIKNLELKEKKIILLK